MKKILIVLVLVVGGFLAYAATRPDTYKVERTAKIDAPAPVVFAQLEDLKGWGAWSPWEKKDPAMKKTYEGPPTGVGSSYSWQGNKDVGKGKMTVVAAEPPKEIKFRLEFMEPFKAVANTGFSVAPDGDRAASVTWAMDGTNDLMGKVFGIFMNMEKAIGGDFEAGLSGLKKVAEAEAQKQANEKAKAAAEAAAVAAKAAAEAAVTAAAAAEAAAPKGKAKGAAKK